MGFFKKLFGKSDSPTEDPIAQGGESLDQSRLVQMFERPPSFSIIAFPGDISAELTEFLSKCGYQVRRTGSFFGPFEDLYDGLGQPTGPNNSIVQKAWFQAAGHTILVDPQMVLITSEAELVQMAARTGGEVKAAIWERASETVALAEIGPEGIIRQSWFCQGEITKEATIGDHEKIKAKPDSEGLKAALAGYGLHGDALFGQVDATVVELQE